MPAAGGADHGEVAPIERRDCEVAKSLGDCDDAGIHKSQTKVGVLLTQVPHPSVVGGCQFGYLNRSLFDRRQKPLEKRVGGTQQPVDLDHYRGWDDDALAGIRQQQCTGIMCVVAGVHRGDQRASVADQERTLRGW